MILLKIVYMLFWQAKALLPPVWIEIPCETADQKTATSAGKHCFKLYKLPGNTWPGSAPGTPNNRPALAIPSIFCMAGWEADFSRKPATCIHKNCSNGPVAYPIEYTAENAKLSAKVQISMVHPSCLEDEYTAMVFMTMDAHPGDGRGVSDSFWKYAKENVKDGAISFKTKRDTWLKVFAARNFTELRCKKNKYISALPSIFGHKVVDLRDVPSFKNNSFGPVLYEFEAPYKTKLMYGMCYHTIQIQFSHRNSSNIMCYKVDPPICKDVEEFKVVEILLENSYRLDVHYQLRFRLSDPSRTYKLSPFRENHDANSIAYQLGCEMIEPFPHNRTCGVEPSEKVFDRQKYNSTQTEMEHMVEAVKSPCSGQVYRCYYHRFVLDLQTKKLFTNFFFCGPVTKGSKVVWELGIDMEETSTPGKVKFVMQSDRTDVTFVAGEKIEYKIQCLFRCDDRWYSKEIGYSCSRSQDCPLPTSPSQFLPGEIVTIQLRRQNCEQRIKTFARKASTDQGGYTQNVQMVQYGHRSLGMVQMKEVEKSFRLMLPDLQLMVLNSLPPNYDQFFFTVQEENGSETLSFSINFLQIEIFAIDRNQTKCQDVDRFAELQSTDDVRAHAKKVLMISNKKVWSESALAVLSRDRKNSINYLPDKMRFGTVLCVRTTFASINRTRTQNQLENDCHVCQQSRGLSRMAPECLHCAFATSNETFITPKPKIFGVSCTEIPHLESLIRIKFSVDIFTNHGDMKFLYSLVEKKAEQVFVEIPNRPEVVSSGCTEPHLDLTKNYVCSKTWQFLVDVTLDSNRKKIIPRSPYLLNLKLTFSQFYSFQTSNVLECQSYKKPPTLMTNVSCTTLDSGDPVTGNFSIVVTWTNFNQFEGEILTINFQISSSAQTVVRNVSIDISQPAGVQNKMTKYEITRKHFPDIYWGAVFDVWIAGITKNGVGGYVVTQCHKPVRAPVIENQDSISDLLFSTDKTIAMKIRCSIFKETFDIIDSYRFFLGEYLNTIDSLPSKVVKAICAKIPQLTYQSSEVNPEDKRYFTSDFAKFPGCYQDKDKRPLKEPWRTFNVTIGDETYEKCANMNPVNRSCNGPLMPSTIYNIFLVGVTRDDKTGREKCAITYLGEFETKGNLEREPPDIPLVLWALIIQCVVLLLALAAYYVYHDYRRKKLYFAMKHRAIAVHRSNDVVFDWRHPIWHLEFPGTVFAMSANMYMAMILEYDRFSEEEFPYFAVIHAHDKFLDFRNSQYPLPKGFHVLPYEHTRVKVSCSYSQDPRDHCLGGYYNANFIKGYKNENPRKYIAAANPKSSKTVNDFWRMVVDNEIRVIVMLEDFYFSQWSLCADYLPEPDGKTPLVVHNFIIIQTGPTDRRGDFYTRKRVHIKDLKTTDQWTIDIFHYPDFPTDGDMEQLEAMLAFVLQVRKTVEHKSKQNSTEILAHCPNGARSCGLYLAADRLLEEARNQNYSDVMGAVADIKCCRKQMVTVVHQYVFLYYLVQLYLMRHKRFTLRRNTTAVTKGQPLQVKHGMDLMQEETQEEDAGTQNFADVDEDKEEALFPQDNRTAIVETVSRAETTESTLRRRRNASIGRRISKDTSLEPVIEEKSSALLSSTNPQDESLETSKVTTPVDQSQDDDVTEKEQKPDENVENKPENAEAVALPVPPSIPEQQPDPIEGIRKRRRRVSRRKTAGNVFDLNRENMRQFTPRPLHVAAADKMGTKFQPNDFNLSKRYDKRMRRKSLADKERPQFDSYRKNARNYFDREGRIRFRSKSAGISPVVKSFIQDSRVASPNAENPDSGAADTPRRVLPRSAAERNEQRRNRRNQSANTKEHENDNFDHNEDEERSYED